MLTKPKSETHTPVPLAEPQFLNQSKPKKIISSLQSMRLFASLGVVQYHIWSNHFETQIGHPGTDFFLVLVAVVAALVQAKRIPTAGWRDYMQGRYIRLYVTYIPIFLIGMAAKFSQLDIRLIVNSFFFVPMGSDSPPIIGATWMLTLFMVFYFVFSIAFLVKDERILIPIFALWTVGIVLYSWFNISPFEGQYWSKNLFNERYLDFIFGYGVGVVLRNYWVKVSAGRWLMWVGVIGIVGGTVLLNINPTAGVRSLILGVPIAIFVLGLCALEQQGITNSPLVNFLTHPWLVWLGGTSYVLYLSHGIFLKVWSAVLPVNYLLVPIINLGMILVGALGYAYWEQPVLKAVNKMLKK